MYDSGDGVATDQAQAAVWYRKAAERDDVYGMMQLGAHLRLGRGVAWSEAEAMQWFEKAARKGYAAAQSRSRKATWLDSDNPQDRAGRTINRRRTGSIPPPSRARASPSSTWA